MNKERAAARDPRSKVKIMLLQLFVIYVKYRQKEMPVYFVLHAKG